MPPKKRTAGPAPKQQSTLAFHAASNKVTKAGARTQNAKNLLNEKATEDVKPELVEIERPDATTIEAAIDQTKAEVVAQGIESTPEEDQAKRITDASIKKYWAQKEKERLAPSVHQQGLSIHEKILRDFDMKSHYGPCTGIARLKRWKRAHKLDLDPPIEILAVLLKEQEGKDGVAAQKSIVDERLNSKADLEV